MLQGSILEQCVPTGGSTLLFSKSEDNPPGGPRRLLVFAISLFIFKVSLSDLFGVTIVYALYFLFTSFL
jgi:hypothetical protein